jgi:hypothetical protein
MQDGTSDVRRCLHNKIYRRILQGAGTETHRDAKRRAATEKHAVQPMESEACKPGARAEILQGAGTETRRDAKRRAATE